MSEVPLNEGVFAKIKEKRAVAEAKDLGLCCEISLTGTSKQNWVFLIGISYLLSFMKTMSGKT